MEKSARGLAVDILARVLDGGAYGNRMLSAELGRTSADRLTKAFVTELVGGCLRNVMYIDFVIDWFARARELRPFIRNVLRLGAYQLIYMDRTPAFAAINEAVALTKERGYADLSGFVNAVLRNIQRNKASLPVPESGDAVRRLSVTYSHPEWISRLFLAELGGDTTALERLLAVNQSAPRVTLAVNTTRTTAERLAEELRAAGVKVRPGRFMPDSLRVSRTNDIRALDCYNKGLFHVMDESAALAVRAANPSPGQVVADVCAAPGGKALLAATLMKNTGRVLARDISGVKLALLAESAGRLGLSAIETEERGAADPGSDPMEGVADIVLVDAPCTGLGVIRKRPEIKLNREPEDIVRMRDLQRGILGAAWRLVKPGGTLVYSTCTLTREENGGNADWFLAHHPFRAESFAEALPEGIAEDAPGRVTVWPHVFSTDGFFVAKFSRRK
ncbi:MAG: 16S rRNA (cytosine(967)-C(5))-methyltransferase RsmB [Clostridiales bacterium]|jgi:16S rRNA (cytosine967-C5)-methyltransferase|nr:16S rRNA (cytosine(967)-C(5))-methyltransferase RsmB [Clostridiales bacterium]